MASKVHCLKAWPEPFRAVREGRKTYEIRTTSDRVFVVGDVLVLQEWDPESESYSGEMVSRRVSYLTPGGAWGLPDDLCVIALEEINAQPEGGTDGEA